jgi:serine/threonine protein kinase
LDYAHERGVIHRDLKPANIMIENGRAKLMDFGIARWTQSPDLRTQTANYIGTPAFMAPEQSFGDVSRESDLYALGVTAFCMVTGRLPFDGPQAGQDKLEGRFEASALGQSGALKDFFTRALDPRAERRFRSGKELLEAFRQGAASLA